jgi:hypothetical protein
VLGRGPSRDHCVVSVVIRQLVVGDDDIDDGRGAVRIVFGDDRLDRAGGDERGSRRRR